MATMTTTTETTTAAIATMPSFNEVNRKQAFDGWMQEVALESTCGYHDLEMFLDDLADYLRPEMEKMLEGKDANILFWWSLRVNYYDPWTRDDDEDDEEDCFGLNDNEDDEHQGMSVYLHSGKLQVRNRAQLTGKMEEAKRLILQRNNGPIRGKTNLVLESIGDVCFKVINNAKKAQ